MKHHIQHNKSKLQVACINERYYYEKYGGALYGLILKLTPDLHLADVLLEASFTSIYKGVSGFDATKGNLFCWMVRIVIKECQQHLNLSNSTVIQKLKKTGYINNIN